MKTLSPAQKQEIRELLSLLAKRPCIPSAHGKGRVCGPCEARKRVERGQGVAAAPVEDHWQNERQS